jgi:hypothetical protein
MPRDFLLKLLAILVPIIVALITGYFLLKSSSSPGSPGSPGPSGGGCCAR